MWFSVYRIWLNFVHLFLTFNDFYLPWLFRWIFIFIYFPFFFLFFFIFVSFMVRTLYISQQVNERSNEERNGEITRSTENGDGNRGLITTWRVALYLYIYFCLLLFSFFLLSAATKPLCSGNKCSTFYLNCFHSNTVNFEMNKKKFVSAQRDYLHANQYFFLAKLSTCLYFRAQYLIAASRRDEQETQAK